MVGKTDDKPRWRSRPGTNLHVKTVTAGRDRHYESPRQAPQKGRTGMTIVASLLIELDPSITSTRLALGRLGVIAGDIENSCNVKILAIGDIRHNMMAQATATPEAPAAPPAGDKKKPGRPPKADTTAPAPKDEPAAPSPAPKDEKPTTPPTPPPAPAPKEEKPAAPPPTGAAPTPEQDEVRQLLRQISQKFGVAHAKRCLDTVKPGCTGVLELKPTDYEKAVKVFKAALNA